MELFIESNRCQRKFVKTDCDGCMIEVAMDRWEQYRIEDEVRALLNYGLDNGETATGGESLSAPNNPDGYGGLWELTKFYQIQYLFWWREISSDPTLMKK